jgi:rifampicin phosphotransferase
VTRGASRDDGAVSTPDDRVQPQPNQQPPATNDQSLIVPLAELDRASLPRAGGKAANLGEMIRAGFPVPGGFCVTTAGYRLVAHAAQLDAVIASAETPLRSEDQPASATLAADARAALLQTPMPEAVATAIRAAYHDLPADAAVAVRSSATAEDLPDASFAGQQDTYLDVVGEEALLDAVRRCWASLWTERAVAYRGVPSS